MATAEESRSEELTPELLTSLLPFASDSERPLIEAELSKRRESETETIAKTRAEAGRLLGVSDRTVSVWQSDPTFPGRAGDVGQANGYYPIEKIRRWNAERKQTAEVDNEYSSLRRRKLAADTRTREVKLARETGDLIALADAQAVIVDAVNAARSQLEAWPSKMVEQVPPKRAKLRRWLLKMATRQVRDVLRSLEDALRGGDDDHDDSEPSGPDLLSREKKRGQKTARRDP